MNDDYHTPPAGLTAAIDTTADIWRDRHRLNPDPNPAASAEENISAHLRAAAALQHAFAATFGVRGWVNRVTNFIDESRRRKAMALHMSTEASRYSTAPAPKTVEYMVSVYARQNGVPAYRFHLNPTPAQARRLRKKQNRLKGTIQV